MATSNFITYDGLPGLYYIPYEELEHDAEIDGIKYDPDNIEGYYDALDQYAEDCFKGCKILWEDDSEVEGFISECNDELQERAQRLSNSLRDVDYLEYESLKNTKIVLKGGYYYGCQIAVEGDYKYLNKTSKKLVKKLFMRIARRFRLPVYVLAYRLSNGETGFTKVKECKPTPRELAMGW